MDMFRAYILQKNLEKKEGTISEKKAEKETKKETISKTNFDLKKEIKKENNIKMNCGFCGQQPYFCMCPRNHDIHTDPS
jgi:hypothetical protein|tara:strand:+ start:148 stop:384 length:237 start_codon:yes stop_codon:yes gene_type:complete